MSREKIEEGNVGEDFAVKYLRNQGYDIKDRNFRLKGGEIDIVAVCNNILVFIEVKTRKSTQFGTGIDAITPRKLKSLIRSANYYKMSHNSLPDEMRVDVISIMLSLNGEIKNFEHIENITY